MQLKKVIESIIPQDEFKNGKVEVVISDNASEDETENIGREYAHKYENIKYFRNEQNLKDRNYPIALSRGTGLLRKLNNDTVVLKAGALKEICDIVMKYQDERPVIFFANGNIKRYKKKRVQFREFILNASFQITWIASFSIWSNECDNIAEDEAGCELLLWQVKKLLEAAYRKNDIYIYNKIFGTVLSVEKKNISYGLYKVFYQNYMALLLPYVKMKSLQMDDIEYLEKDLLYRFFTNWTIKWEMQVPSLQYSEEENLKEKIIEQYKNKKYWKHYAQFYKIKLRLYQIRYMLTKNLY